MVNLNLSSIRVMVIDDHQTMRKILRQLLGVVGIKDIMEAKHGEEALALVKDPQITDPDVILCDLHMDQMDGMEFCNKMRRTDGISDPAIPILMLTGDEDPMLHEVGRHGLGETFLRSVECVLPLDADGIFHVASHDVPISRRQSSVGPSLGGVECNGFF